MQDSEKATIYVLFGCALVLFGCTFITPHENFRQMIESGVGQSIRDDGLAHARITSQGQLKGVRQLENGNREFAFQINDGRPCHYFYEVNPEDLIVSWRFEGTAKACSIAP